MTSTPSQANSSLVGSALRVVSEAVFGRRPPELSGGPAQHTRSRMRPEEWDRLIREQTHVKRKVKPKAIRIAKEDNGNQNNGTEDQTTENMEQTAERNRDLENNGTNESHQNMDFSNEILTNGTKDTEDRTISEDQINEDLSRIVEEVEEDDEDEDKEVPQVETLEEVLERMRGCKSMEQIATEYTTTITAWMGSLVLAQELRLVETMDKMNDMMAAKVNEIGINVEEVSKRTVMDVVEAEVIPKIESQIKSTLEDYRNDQYVEIIKDREERITQLTRDRLEAYKDREKCLKEMQERLDKMAEEKEMALKQRDKAIEAKDNVFDLFRSLQNESKEHINRNTESLNKVVNEVTGEDAEWIIGAANIITSNTANGINELIPTATQIAKEVNKVRNKETNRTIPKTIVSPKPKKRVSKRSESEDSIPPKVRKKTKEVREKTSTPERPQQPVEETVEFHKLQKIPKYEEIRYGVRSRRLDGGLREEGHVCAMAQILLAGENQ